VGTFHYPLHPVDNCRFSTEAVHGANRLPGPDPSVFPVVHTPYDFYERI
jgi:hypothetical protein